MSEQLASLGMFVFGLDRPNYDELQRRTDWRWEGTPRYGARDALQFTGPGRDSITLNGKLIPEIAGSYSDLDTLREMGGSGEVYPLTLGDGTVIGDFVITTVDDRWRNILLGGRARLYDFAIDLEAFQP